MAAISFGVRLQSFHHRRVQFRYCDNHREIPPSCSSVTVPQVALVAPRSKSNREVLQVRDDVKLCIRPRLTPARDKCRNSERSGTTANLQNYRPMIRENKRFKDSARQIGGMTAGNGREDVPWKHEEGIASKKTEKLTEVTVGCTGKGYNSAGRGRSGPNCTPDGVTLGRNRQ